MSDDFSSFSMIDLFHTEAETHLAALNEALLELESNPAAIASHGERLMRAAHSLKGAAKIMNFDSIVHLAHVMEDGFVALQEGRAHVTPETVDTYLAACDLLKPLTTISEAGFPEWQDKHRGELEALAQRVSDVIAGRAAQNSAVVEDAPVAAPIASPATPPENFGLAPETLFDLFREELRNQVQLLSAGLLALETTPSADSTLRELMRAAHSIKGAARMMAVDPLVQLAHSMENCFVEAQKGPLQLKPEQIDIFLRAADLFSGIPQLAFTAFDEWLRTNEKSIKRFISGFSAMLETPAAPAKEQPVPVKPAEPKPVDKSERVVRLGAENLNRLMEMAAESLVETRRLRPFGDSLLTLQTGHFQLESALRQFRDELERESANPRIAALLRTIETKVESTRQYLDSKVDEFDAFVRRSSALSDKLYDEVISTRMRPFGDGVAGFPRMVRDLSRTLRKKVRFTIAGKETPVDRDILEKLEAPLNHILRNALDHAIELPADRAAHGKPEEGHIKLEAAHAAGMLRISISDDGKGIDPEWLRGKIIARGMVPHAAAQQLSEAELLEFLFLPGFSTADKVTDISGRGVGLDVVQTMVQEVGGTVRIISQPRVGTTFLLQLPLTRSVLRALILEIAGEPYALPLPRLDQVVKVAPDQVKTVEGRPYIQIDGKNVAVVAAEDVLEIPSDPKPRDLHHIVVMSDRNHQYGLEVGNFLGERDLVVRPLDARLGKIPDISSASVLEDGSPILILDVDDLVRSIDNLAMGGRLSKAQVRAQVTSGLKHKRVLVVDDSITVRELERQLLRTRGYEVEVAVDGMEGWNAVRFTEYDLVVSDVDMPRMTGIELVRLIRGEQRTKHIPVIIVSYKDREEDRLRGMEAGANYYLTKSSFQDDTFITAVEDLIGKAVE